MRFLSGVVFTVALALVFAILFVASGLYDVAASKPPGGLEKAVARLTMNRSVGKRAGKTANPLSGPDVIRAGLAHYREMCVFCHGAPGVDASEAGEGLNPPAPDLTIESVQRRTDGELFWIVQNGIRMTGMPAFGGTHKDAEIWKIVAFLRHLPQITKDEQAALKAGTEAGEKPQ
jgi:mono/diheme cytochrome c family protein